MPATYAHYRFGQDVLKTLPDKYKKVLLQEEDLFNIGVHGPDLLFYYKPFSHDPLHAEGGRMHRLTGREYFTEAGKTFLAIGHHKADYAYLCGFLCHFALDRACHGYINDLTAKGQVSHEEIESEFDRILLEEDGIDPIRKMLCCGVRNNEAAGLNFGDISEMIDHPGYYTLRITRTSVRDRNERKAGGKTRNAARRLALFKKYTDFILARKEYLLSVINFPYTDENMSTFNSIDELPIACRGNNYTIPCSASDLTRAGRAFLRDKLKLREQQISGLSYIVQNSEYDASEKDPTTYILRRNFATHLYTLGFPTEWSQYYMGHLIENDILKRSDFNDEGFLYQMALLLERHPLNRKVLNSDDEITIDVTDSSRYYISIENKELDDPISVLIKCPHASAEVMIGKSDRELPTEIDITSFMNYKKC